MLDPQYIGGLINKYAIKYSLRPEIVAAIIIQESDGDTWAWRPEDEWYDKNLKGKGRGDLAGFVPPPGTLPSLMGELRQRSCSFGLMQVLGDTARWCGKVTSPFLSVLHDPDRGIDTGCRVFQFYLKRAKGYYPAALKMWNGSMVYADEVLQRVEHGEHKRFFEGA